MTLGRFGESQLSVFFLMALKTSGDQQTDAHIPASHITYSCFSDKRRLCGHCAPTLRGFNAGDGGGVGEGVYVRPLSRLWSPSSGQQPAPSVMSSCVCARVCRQLHCRTTGTISITIIDQAQKKKERKSGRPPPAPPPPQIPTPTLTSEAAPASLDDLSRSASDEKPADYPRVSPRSERASEQATVCPLPPERGVRDCRTCGECVSVCVFPSARRSSGLQRDDWASS